MMPVLQANIESDNKWDNYVMNAECQLNNAYGSTLGDTPFHILYGFLPSFTDSILHQVIAEDTWDET
jgi:hypothetical protein